MGDVKISSVLWEALRQMFLAGGDANGKVGVEILMNIIYEEIEYKDRRVKTREAYLKGKFGRVGDKDKYVPPLGVPAILKLSLMEQKSKPKWLDDELRQQIRSLYGISLPEEKKWVNPDEDFFA